MNNRALSIPVILGTTRKGRASEHVGKFVFEQVKKRDGVETKLIDIRDLKFPIDDAGEAIKETPRLHKRSWRLMDLLSSHLSTTTVIQAC
jgi:NAD(P)H-dependent FMN reductase